MAPELKKRLYDFRYLILAGSLSALGSLDNSEVTIFQVPNSQLVFVSNSIPNSQYSFSQTQSCNQPIPSAPIDQINYSISNMTWGETRISFEINLNQSAYVLVSNPYSLGWMATDNGSLIPIQILPPGLPVLHLPKGMSDIGLYCSGEPDSQNSALLSLGAFLGVRGFSIQIEIRKRKP